MTGKQHPASCRSAVKSLLGFVREETLAAALTLIQLKSHLFAEEARATDWEGEGGRESFKVCSTAQRSHLCWVLHGFTICAPPHNPSFPYTSSPSSHMFLPPTNVRSKPPALPPLLPPSTSSSSHKPKKKNKKDTQKLPLAALRTPRPEEWEGEFREQEQRRRGRVKGYIFYIVAQVSFSSPPDVTLTHVKQQEEGGKRLKLENLIYLIISQNN